MIEVSFKWTLNGRGVIYGTEFLNCLRQVLFDVQAGNSNLAKSLSEKSNHAMYQNENLHTCLLSLHTYQN